MWDSGDTSRRGAWWSCSRNCEVFRRSSRLERSELHLLPRPLAATTITPIFQTGLHEFLGRNNQLGSEIAEAYHFVS